MMLPPLGLHYRRCMIVWVCDSLVSAYVRSKLAIRRITEHECHRVVRLLKKRFGGSRLRTSWGCTLRSVHGAERAAPGHRLWTLAEQLYDSRSRIHRVAGRFIDRTPYKTTFELLFASYGVHEPPDFCGIANALTFAYRTSEIEHETHASTRNCLAFRAREDQGSQAPADRDGRCSLCFRSHRNNIRSYALTIATFGRIHSLRLRRQQTGFSCLRYASLLSRVRPRWYVAVFAHRRQRHCRLADKTRGFG